LKRILLQAVAAAASPPAFLPTNIAGLQVWYRADVGVTISSGVKVSKWADQSGIGDANRTVIQTAAARQPTLNASDASYNNQKTISFASASSQMLYATGSWSPSVAMPYTIFVVGNGDGTANYRNFIGLLATNVYGLLDQNNFFAGFYDMADPAGDNMSSTTAVSAAARVFVMEYVATLGTSTLRISQTTPQSTSTLFNSSSLTSLQVGGRSSTFGTFDGKIAEIIVYNSILSAADLASVQTYLGARYGITIGP
jgi:hypothetical protein